MLDMTLTMKDRSTGDIVNRFVKLSVSPRAFENIERLMYALENDLDVQLVAQVIE